MPYTLNGIGTTFYGKRDRGPDGSFITTKWIVVVFVPLIPLGSYRVLPVAGGVNYGLYSSRNYRIAKVPMNWKQVRKMYLWIGSIVGGILLLVGALILLGGKT